MREVGEDNQHTQLAHLCDTLGSLCPSQKMLFEIVGISASTLVSSL